MVLIVLLLVVMLIICLNYRFALYRILYIYVSLDLHGKRSALYYCLMIRL